MVSLTVCMSCANAAWVHDDRGVRVELPESAKRVISVSPFTTELIYALGAGNLLVAVSDHSDYPPAAKQLPRVSNAFAVDLESVIALQPDLVIGWKSGGDPRITQRLEKLGIPVYLSEPRKFMDIESTLERLGVLLGVSDEARVQAESFRNAIEFLRQEYSNRESVRVFYQIAEKPLMTLNGQHMVSRVLELCGGWNIFSDVSVLVPVITREQVLKYDPQLILISSTIQQSNELRDQWYSFEGMSASENKSIFLVESSLLNRQTPRLALGAKQVCEFIEQARSNLRE